MTRVTPGNEEWVTLGSICFENEPCVAVTYPL